MAKRNLTRRQAWRISKIQQERRQRAQGKAVAEGALQAETGLGPEQPGLLITNFGASVEVEAEDGSTRRCLLRQNLEELVVGDRVVWQADREGGGVVVAVEPRHSLLQRPDFSGRLRPVAANIDQILVVFAPLPAYSTELIDQYLVAAESTGIAPALLANKTDLLDEAARTALEQALAPYRGLGYPLLHASTHARHGLDELTAALRGKHSVFVGQSGVGKSSLVKALLPETAIRVGELSEASGLGQHTTSASRLYHLPAGGNIIDSPGVREFRLWEMTREELAWGFIEFRPHLGRCRFRNCRHNGEPGCALEAALESGEISAVRLASFRRLAAQQEATR